MEMFTSGFVSQRTSFIKNYGFVEVHHTPGVAASGSGNSLAIFTSQPEVWPRIPFSNLSFQRVINLRTGFSLIGKVASCYCAHPGLNPV
jgi:hypothetical protein